MEVANNQRIDGIKRTVEKKLYQYPQYKRDISADQPHSEAAGWVWAIEAALRWLENTSPPHARIVSEFYGLKRLNRSKRHATALRVQLEHELAIEKSTFYAWKNEALDAVAHAAIQCGVIIPFPELRKEAP